jgi:DNA-binding SARP family transcriptional activator/Tfp pilus assembly protein PilF
MYSLRLLGGVDLEGPSGPVTGPAVQRRRLAVLAMLAMSGENGCSRDKLVGHVWPEREEERARHVLATALYVFRSELGEEAVLAKGEYLRLNPEVVRSDVEVFAKALESGDLERATDAYGGPFLEGFYLKEAPEFERWVESERARLADRCAGALEKLAEQAEAAEEYPRAVACWKRLTALDVYNSRYVVRLMEALVAAGDPGNAIQRAQEHERLLREMLDAEPAPAVRALAEGLRREAVEPRGSAERRAVAPAGHSAEPAPEVPARPGRAGLLRALAIYAAVAVGVVVTAHIFTLQFGLPGWLFRSVVVLLVACLPVVVVTAFVAGTPAGRGWVSWRNTIAFVATGFALLGLAVSGYMATRAMGIGPWGSLIGQGVLQARDLIVLADFEDSTGDSMQARAVTEAFRVDLGQSPVVRVASREYVGQVLHRMEVDPDGPLTYDLAREVAIREGLKAVVSGEINTLGSSYVVSARVVVAETGEEVSFRETASDLDAIILAIDRLSARLRERIGESLKTIRASLPLSQLRTASLEALRLYTEADRAILSGEFRRACDLLDQAIELDSAFASAYRTRARCLGLVGFGWDEQIEDMTRAYELRHQLPPVERYTVEASYYLRVNRDLERRINACRAIVELDPDEVYGAHCLGTAYHSLGDQVRAEEWFRREVEIDSGAAIGWLLLARSQFNQGEFGEAEETLRQWETRQPNDPGIPRYRAHFAAALGDYAAAEEHVRKARELYLGSGLWQARTSRYLGRLVQVQGRLTGAEGHFRHAMAEYEILGNPRGYLGVAIEIASSRVWFIGDTTSALELVTRALESFPLDSIVPLDPPYGFFGAEEKARRYNLAGFFSFAGSTEQAREILVRWEARIPPELKGFSEASRRLQWGVLALVEGRAQVALAELQAARDGSGNFSFLRFPLLGRAYELAEQPDSAISMYEKYLSTLFHRRVIEGTSPSDGNEPYWLPVVYERLGALYEQRADTANAILYYGKLVDLWKDADPELQPRVEAARRAMRSLTPER